MSEKVWLGPVFIKGEGFEIIMRALNHYNKRLHRIAQSPEIADAGAMFGSVLEAESKRVAPTLRPIAEKLRAGLVDTSQMTELRKDVPLIQKALTCYKSDIKKAQGSTGGYYYDMVAGNTHIQSDLGLIDQSIKKLEQYD